MVGRCPSAKRMPHRAIGRPPLVHIDYACSQTSFATRRAPVNQLHGIQHCCGVSPGAGLEASSCMPASSVVFWFGRYSGRR